MLRWLSVASTTRRQLLVLLADLAFTAMVGLAAFVIYLYIFAVNEDVRFLEYFTQYTLPLKADFVSYVSPGIWFYSTFLTSVWIWLYCLSGLVAVCAKRMGWGIGKMTRLLDVRNSPFISLGAIAIVMVTVTYCAFALVVVVILPILDN